MKAREGNKKLRAILLRYDRMVAAKREKEKWKHIFRKEMVRSRDISPKLSRFIHHLFGRHGKNGCEIAPSSLAVTFGPRTLTELYRV